MYLLCFIYVLFNKEKKRKEKKRLKENKRKKEKQVKERKRKTS